jgi:hypothetical protein
MPTTRDPPAGSPAKFTVSEFRGFLPLPKGRKSVSRNLRCRHLSYTCIRFVRLEPLLRHPSNERIRSGYWDRSSPHQPAREVLRHSFVTAAAAISIPTISGRDRSTTMTRIPCVQAESALLEAVAKGHRLVAIRDAVDDVLREKQTARHRFAPLRVGYATITATLMATSNVRRDRAPQSARIQLRVAKARRGGRGSSRVRGSGSRLMLPTSMAHKTVISEIIVGAFRLRHL